MEKLEHQTKQQKANFKTSQQTTTNNHTSNNKEDEEQKKERKQQIIAIFVALTAMLVYAFVNGFFIIEIESLDIIKEPINTDKNN